MTTGNGLIVDSNPQVSKTEPRVRASIILTHKAAHAHPLIPTKSRGFKVNQRAN